MQLPMQIASGGVQNAALPVESRFTRLPRLRESNGGQVRDRTCSQIGRLARSCETILSLAQQLQCLFDYSVSGNSKFFIQNLVGCRGAKMVYADHRSPIT